MGNPPGTQSAADNARLWGAWDDRVPRASLSTTNIPSKTKIWILKKTLSIQHTVCYCLQLHMHVSSQVQFFTSPLLSQSCDFLNGSANDRWRPNVTISAGANLCPDGGLLPLSSVAEGILRVPRPSFSPFSRLYQ